MSTTGNEAGGVAVEAADAVLTPTAAEPGAAPVRRAPYHHGDLRNALIDAARRIARESGPDSLTLRAAAREAGVSHAAAYKHFTDKDDVLRALGVRAFEDLAGVLRRLIEDGDPGLEELGVAYLHFAAAAPAEFRFMFRRELCMPEGMPDPLKEAGRGVQARLTERIAELQRAGRLSAGAAEELSLAAWAMMHGIVTIVLETPAFVSALSAEIEHVMRSAMRSLDRGIGGRSTE
ncbi:MAG: TetR/AcrR family transcriptional regulator [Nocardioides sp.]